MCDACLQLKRKVQKYKADVLGGQEIPRSFGLFFFFEIVQ